MKVAVVLTGHMRCWETVFPNFKEKIIDKYSPDIFIHTWSDEGWWTPGDKVTETGVYDNSPKLDIDKIVEAYNPKEIVVEHWNDFNSMFEERGSKFENFAHKPRNILSMFYKLSAGVNIMNTYAAKNGIQYDYVIRIRPDMIIDDLPDFEINKFYTLQHKNHLGQGTGDMIQAGNPLQMTLFSMLPQSMDVLYNVVMILCPHVMSQAWIQGLHLNWEEFSISKTIMHSPNGPYKEVE